MRFTVREIWITLLSVLMGMCSFREHPKECQRLTPTLNISAAGYL